jgi:hypothetical protein
LGFFFKHGKQGHRFFCCKKVFWSKNFLVKKKLLSVQEVAKTFFFFILASAQEVAAAGPNGVDELFWHHFAHRDHKMQSKLVDATCGPRKGLGCMV